MSKISIKLPRTALGGVFPTLLAAATILHAILIFTIAFEPQRVRSIPPSLEVLLVEKSTQYAPQDAEYLAQVSQDGGGQSNDNTRPSAPFAATEPLAAKGIAAQPVEATSPTEKVTASTAVSTQDVSDYAVTKQVTREQVTEVTQAKKAATLQRQLEIAQLTAEINDRLEKFAKRPKKKFLTARTQEASAAAYMLRWVEHVERIGNLNYPALGNRPNTHKSLIMVVSIDRFGRLLSSEIVRSSGSQALDANALNIVQTAAPFPPLSTALAADTDILYITRTWEFQRNQVLSSR